MRYQTVLFDLDYTLGDASSGILTCFRHVLSEMNYPLVSDDVLRHTIGNTLEDSFTIVTGESAPERRELFCTLYMQKADTVMTHALHLYPQTLPLLEALQAAGCRMAVVSTRPVRRLEQMLQTAGIRSFFHVLIGVDSVTNPKPDPSALLLAMEHCGAARKGTLYLGDTVIDAEAAKNAGIDFVAVTTGMTPKEMFDDFPTRLVAEHLGQVKEWMCDEACLRK
ncbi:MAG: HAD-IA family hydrolase [Oscillospiraceae bacterium]|nr:HAD-IA family hydrolase [Oscillospiraceae bacterium]